MIDADRLTLPRWDLPIVRSENTFSQALQHWSEAGVFELPLFFRLRLN